MTVKSRGLFGFEPKCEYASGVHSGPYIIYFHILTIYRTPYFSGGGSFKKPLGSVWKVCGMIYTPSRKHPTIFPPPPTWYLAILIDGVWYILQPCLPTQPSHPRELYSLCQATPTGEPCQLHVIDIYIYDSY